MMECSFARQSRQFFRMHVRPSELPDVLIIEPRTFADGRGYFFESYHAERYAQSGLAAVFVQDNLSRSKAGTLRGLHFQRHRPQGKLVTVVRGAIFDVAVDVRRRSPTFGRWMGLVLSDENHSQLYIPPGFAHGFCVLSPEADVLYKCTDIYCPEHERTLLWNDPTVGIEWPVTGAPLLSLKDAAGMPLDRLDLFDD